jgi:equilibrative nucleoside transporter 1/2/3
LPMDSRIEPYCVCAYSGVLASLLRVITKASMSQTIEGLRLSADVYFIVTAVFLLLCFVSYNLVYKLPIMLHYNSVKIGAMESTLSNGPHDASELGLKTDATEISLITTGDSELTNFARPVSYWHVWSQIQWLAASVALIYVVTMSIFPGYITEDVHSEFLGDWYPVLLIAAYNVADLAGKVLTSVYMVENQTLMVRACFGRLLFFPLFYTVLHGPAFFRTETPVFLLTFLLGLTNGYFTSVLMIVAPKNVSILESETAGIVMTLFLVTGLTAGCLLGWVWII